MDTQVHFVVDLEALEQAKQGGQPVPLPFAKVFGVVTEPKDTIGDLDRNTFLYLSFDPAAAGLTQSLVRKVIVAGVDQERRARSVLIDGGCAVVTLDEGTAVKFEDIDDVHAHVVGLLSSDDPKLGMVSPVAAIAVNRGDSSRAYSDLPVCIRPKLQ